MFGVIVTAGSIRDINEMALKQLIELFSNTLYNEQLRSENGVEMSGRSVGAGGAISDIVLWQYVRPLTTAQSFIIAW